MRYVYMQIYDLLAYFLTTCNPQMQTLLAIDITSITYNTFLCLTQNAALGLQRWSAYKSCRRVQRQLKICDVDGSVELHNTGAANTCWSESWANTARQRTVAHVESRPEEHQPQTRRLTKVEGCRSRYTLFQSS